VTSRYVKLAEIIDRFHVDLDWLHMLEAEGLIELKQTGGEELVLSAEDADRIRVIRTLTDEMDVNLAGVEVIVHMREEMLAMQRQFDEILEILVAELRQRLKR
jgi:MerR family transcriptional regulator/heat shock protein HspR